jgi:hypothetical protein
VPKRLAVHQVLLAPRGRARGSTALAERLLLSEKKYVTTLAIACPRELSSLLDRLGGARVGGPLSRKGSASSQKPIDHRTRPERP